MSNQTHDLRSGTKAANAQSCAVKQLKRKENPAAAGRRAPPKS